MNKYMKNVLVVCMVAVAVINVGCRRPYQVPIFKDIEAHETAFKIPLEGDTSKQDSFSSAALILERKIATKRIEIPTRWVQTGRASFGMFDINGEWKPTTKIITVNRTPVSKQFTSDDKTGSSKRNQGLYAESRDSIGVSSGFAITALIEENEAHLFLNKFKGDSLSAVMDNQLFNSIQAVYTEVCNKYNLNELRSQKQEITDVMRLRIIPMYKEWGITILPDMGLIGGFTYDDKEIQAAINAVFVNQTKKEGNEALRDAQEALNQQKLSEKKNIAAMFMVDKKAEADGIALVAKAINEAGEIYIRNKQLEVMADAVKRWNGAPPSVLGGSIPMMFNTPLPESK